MTIKSLKSKSQLPRDIKKQIERVLELRKILPEEHFLIKGNEFFWGIWDKNVDLTDWSAVLLSSSFFLSFLEALQNYFQDKYGIRLSTKVRKDKSLQENIEVLKKASDKKIDERDIEWFNQEIMSSIMSVVRSITTENITSINDLVALANIGNQQLKLLKRVAEKPEDRQEQLNQAFLSYINSLIEANFIDVAKYRTLKGDLVDERWSFFEYLGEPLVLHEEAYSIKEKEKNYYVGVKDIRKIADNIIEK